MRTVRNVAQPTQGEDDEEFEIGHHGHNGGGSNAARHVGTCRSVDVGVHERQ